MVIIEPISKFKALFYTISTSAIRFITLWLWGGAVYYCIELLWRQKSHPSMFILGGICFIILSFINKTFSWQMSIIVQVVLGAISIVLCELIGGIIINILLGLHVWDYSHLKFNFLGQISLIYSILWIPISAIGIFLDDFLRWKIFNEQAPRYSLR